MAGLIDFISLLVTVGVLGGTAYGILYAAKQISESIKSTKETLKSKGYDISGNRVSIKTSKRFDRGDYIDATQRGMLKTMTATSFNRRTDSMDSTPSTPNSRSSSPYPSPLPSAAATSSSFLRPGHVERTASTTSAKSGGSEKKKKGLFGLKRNSS